MYLYEIHYLSIVMNGENQKYHLIKKAELFQNIFVYCKRIFHIGMNFLLHLSYFFLPVLFWCSLIPAYGQVTFWIADFENTVGNNAWTYNVSTGANSGLCNWWYRSCQEDGKANGVCGTGCGTNETMHVGSQSLGDIGAAYDASEITHRAVYSPNINTAAAGTSPITLLFEYIEYGEPGWDYAVLYYSINGGASWIVLENPIPTATCCGGCNGQNQGRWTTRSYVLPGTCNNIANFRIGVNWINDNSAGSDPSFAMNDVRLQYTPFVPIELLSFSAKPKEDIVELRWETATEINNDYFEIERSEDGDRFVALAKIKGSGNSTQSKHYTFTDKHPLKPLDYYRLRQTDFDGSFTYSDIVAVKLGTDQMLDIMKINTVQNDEVLQGNVYAFEDLNARIEILDMDGRSLITRDRYRFIKGRNVLQLSLNNLPVGTYFLKLTNEPDNNQARKIEVIKRFVII